jgi:uncharacterized glyoxalase superfamily protein PhnB
MKPNRTMPDCTVLPELVYDDVGAAVDWLCDRFGLAERWRAGNHRAQLAVGTGAIVVAEPGHRPLEGRVSLVVRIDDADALFARCVRGGVEILTEPRDYPYGERQFTVRDPGGHEWTFSESVADVEPEVWGGQRPAAPDGQRPSAASPG